MTDMTDVDAATQAERLTALLSLTPDDEHLGEPIPLSDVPLAFARTVKSREAPAAAARQGIVGQENQDVVLQRPFVGSASLSPSALRVESQSSFCSVRANAVVFGSRWQYEVTLESCGVLQVGWATREYWYQCSSENGVGDVPFSYAYDGKRRKKWNGGSASYGEQWATGDVIGVCIDLTVGTISYYRNGRSLGVAFENLPRERVGLAYFPAMSISQHESCQVNFGGAPFIYPVEDYAPLQPRPSGRCVVASYLLDSFFTLAREPPSPVVIMCQWAALERVAALLSSGYVCDAELLPRLLFTARHSGIEALSQLFSDLVERLEPHESIKMMENVLESIGRRARSLCVLPGVDAPVSGSASVAEYLEVAQALFNSEKALAVWCTTDVQTRANVSRLSINVPPVPSVAARVLEHLFSTPEYSDVDLERLLPVPWAPDLEDTENPLSSVENFAAFGAVTSRIQQESSRQDAALRTIVTTFMRSPTASSWFMEWLTSLLKINEGIAREIQPSGLSNPTTLSRILLTLLRYVRSDIIPHGFPKYDVADVLPRDDKVTIEAADTDVFESVSLFGGALTVPKWLFVSHVASSSARLGGVFSHLEGNLRTHLNLPRPAASSRLRGSQHQREAAELMRLAVQCASRLRPDLVVAKAPNASSPSSPSSSLLLGGGRLMDAVRPFGDHVNATERHDQSLRSIVQQLGAHAMEGVVQSSHDDNNGDDDDDDDDEAWDEVDAAEMYGEDCAEFNVERNADTISDTNANVSTFTSDVDAAVDDSEARLREALPTLPRSFEVIEMCVTLGSIVGVRVASTGMTRLRRMRQLQWHRMETLRVLAALPTKTTTETDAVDVDDETKAKETLEAEVQRRHLQVRVESFDKEIATLARLVGMRASTTLDDENERLWTFLSVLSTDILRQFSSTPYFEFVPEHYMEVAVDLMSSLCLWNRDKFAGDECEERASAFQRVLSETLVHLSDRRIVSPGMTELLSRFVSVFGSDTRVMAAVERNATVRCYLLPSLLALFDDERMWVYVLAFVLELNPETAYAVPSSMLGLSHVTPSTALARTMADAIAAEPVVARACLNNVLNYLNRVLTEFTGAVQDLLDTLNVTVWHRDDANQARIEHRIRLTFCLVTALSAFLEQLALHGARELFLDGTEGRVNRKRVSQLVFAIVGRLVNITPAGKSLEGVLALKLQGWEDFDRARALVPLLGCLEGIQAAADRCGDEMTCERVMETLVSLESFDFDLLRALLADRSLQVAERPWARGRMTAFAQFLRRVSHASDAQKKADKETVLRSTATTGVALNGPGTAAAQEQGGSDRNNSSVVTGGGGDDDGVDEDDGLCTICYASVANVSFEPCAHRSCEECITRHLMNSKACFFCKETVQKVIEDSIV